MYKTDNRTYTLVLTYGTEDNATNGNRAYTYNILTMVGKILFQPIVQSLSIIRGST